MVKKNHMDHPRHQILKVEKKIYRENQEIINDSAVVLDTKFKTYLQTYKKAIKDYRKVIGFKDVLKKISKSDISLFGDYHTLDQSQRSFVRYLRQYIAKYGKKNIIVCLEKVQSRHQKYLTQYLEKEISAEDFIKKIGYKKHWFFDLWDNYKIIFDFLRYHKIKAVAIDSDNRKDLTLKERDSWMGNEILKQHEKNPDAKVFVLVGDLHLAPPHLHKSIFRHAKKDKLKKMPKLLSVYQNSSNIYWKLSEKRLVDHATVVEISKNEICRMHTPPIIVQQSYLNWLYQDEGTFDWIDAKHSFLNIVERLVRIIGLYLPEEYENVEVYTCGDLSFLKKLESGKTFSKKQIKFIRNQVLESMSYFLPRARMIYIANVSVHHAAEEASHYLKFLFCGEDHPRESQDAFYNAILNEAIGFFGSKLFNHKRKSSRLADFKNEKKYIENNHLLAKRSLEYEVAKYFILHDQLSKKRKLFKGARIKNMSSDLFLGVTHAIGHDLGDRLYYGFMDGAIEKDVVQYLFQDRFDEDGEPCEVYLKLVRLLKAVKRPRVL